MAKSTSFLGLTLPALGEFFNKWNVPVNSNFEKIDAFASGFGSELEEARGSAASLGNRLNISMNADGTLKDVPEVTEARSSSVFGSGAGSVFFSLDDRLEASDREVFAARQGLASLASSLAWAGDDVTHNCLVSGPTNPISFANNKAWVNGDVAPVVANINGYRAVVATKLEVEISGTAGAYYLYLDRNADGKTFLTPTASSGATGLISSTQKLSKFTVTGANLVAAGVKPGHILEITGPAGNTNLGRWIVLETSVENSADLSTSEVRIIGEFPSSLTGLSCRFIDPQAPNIGFTAAAPSPIWSAVSGRIYIAKVVFNGTSITDLTPFAYQGRFATWQQVALVGGEFNYTVNHNLGFIPRKIHVFASQANDFSLPLDPMEFGRLSQGSIALSPGSVTISSGLQSLSVVEPEVAYTAPSLRRAVVVQVTATSLFIKNATSGFFYEDFNGNAHTTGYLYVVVER